MKRQLATLGLTTLGMIALISTVFAVPPMPVDGATQISGIGVYAQPGECTDPEGAGSDYALVMSGDLVGCHYTFVAISRCSPGGAYYEAGTETFVGEYNGSSGSFRTTYVFTATYQDCPNFIGEIAGRCQHPITAGSGTGGFDGVTGRLDMKDNVVAGNFPYRGHLAFDEGLALVPSRESVSPTGRILAARGGC